MAEDWLDIMLHGTYGVSIPALTATGDDVGTFTGSGQIAWDAKTGIHIRAVTGGGEAINQLLFKSHESPATSSHTHRSSPFLVILWEDGCLLLTRRFGMVIARMKGNRTLTGA